MNIAVFSKYRLQTAFVTVFLAVSCLIYMVSVVAIERTKNSGSEKILSDSKHALTIVHNELHDLFDQQLTDVLTLSGNEMIGKILSDGLVKECSEKSNSQECLKQASQNLEAQLIHYMTVKRLYYKIRIISKFGLEVVKVRNKDGQFLTAKKRSRVTVNDDFSDKLDFQILQNVNSRYYFKEAIALDRGEVFISAFDGNMEKGMLESPFLPTIRFATPVYYQSEKVGLLVLNADGNRILEFMRSIAKPYSGLQLLNNEGYWLFNHNEKKMFDFLYKNKHSFGKGFPLLWSAIRHQTNGVLDNQEGILLFEEFHPLQAHLAGEDGGIRSHPMHDHRMVVTDLPWKIAIHFPRDEVDLWGMEEQKRIVWFALTLEFLLAIIFLLLFRWIKHNRQTREEEINHQRVLMSRLCISSLMEISTKPLSLEQMLAMALETILSLPWLPVDRKGAIFLADNANQTLTLATQLDLPLVSQESCRTVPFGRCLCGKAAVSKEVVFVAQMDEQHEITYPGIEPHGHYCIPILSNDLLLAVLNIYVAHNHVKNAEEEAFLHTAAQTLASIIQRKQLETEQHKDNETQQIIRNLEGIIAQEASLGQKMDTILHAVFMLPWLEKITGGFIVLQESQRDSALKVYKKVRDDSVVCSCLEHGNHAQCLHGLKALAQGEETKFRVLHATCDQASPHLRFGVFTCPLFDAMICFTLDQSLLLKHSASEVATLFSEKEMYSIQTVGNILSDVLLHEHHKEEILKFQRAVEQSPVSVVITDVDANIEYVNNKFITVTGYSFNEVLGKNPRLLKSGTMPVSVYRHMWESLTSGKEWHGELCNRHKNGSLYWESVLISPIFGPDGMTRHYIAVKEDITQKRKEAEERQVLERQLRQAQKMEALGHLTGGIAHDFNNILAAIQGFAELAMVRYARDEQSKLHKYLSSILTASSRARDLIAQMMTFSRSQEKEVSRVSLIPLVKEVVKLMRATLPTSISITFSMTQGDVTIQADPVQLHQTLMNLFVNSRDALSGKGRIDTHVHVESEGSLLTCSSCHSPFYTDKMVVITIKDDGPGIDDGIQNKIFQPFYTTKEVGQGTGMGLSVVHGILHSLQGHIILESEVGQGTEFRLYFHPCEGPITESPAVAATTPHPHELLQGRALLVDDEVSILEFLKDVLEEEGLSVITKSSSMEALAWFQSDPQRVDVVISDQTMPEMTGIEMIQKMRLLRPNLPTILCTGFSRDVNAESATKHGVDHFLGKPIPLPRLKQILTSLFANGKLSAK